MVIGGVGRVDLAAHDPKTPCGISQNCGHENGGENGHPDQVVTTA